MSGISLKTLKKLRKEILSQPNFPALFFARAAKLKGRPFLWAKNEKGKYKSLSWKQTATQVTQLALGLKKMGLKKGDRVVILSENRPEWFIADMAIMAAGGISVPAYTTNTVANNQHIIKDSGAHFAVISTLPLATKMMKAAIDSFWKMKLICIEVPEVQQSGVVEVASFSEVLAMGRREQMRYHNRNALDAGPSIDDIACLIYTSGTGGAPKGVMLTYKNLLSNISAVLETTKDAGFDLYQERFLSVLPLSHSYEHTAGELLAMTFGAQIYYLSSMDKLLQDMQQAKPTVMVAVPRLFEVVKTRMHQTMKRKGNLALNLFNLSVRLGEKEARGEHLTFKEVLQNWFVNRTIRHKIRSVFGDNIKAFVAGGAPLGEDIGLFFASLKMPILQGYGQTEASPFISCNLASKNDSSTVGFPMTGVEIKFALDGEILVKGDNVMKGYWNNQKATEAAVDASGWLHTGDIGIMDDLGRIKITDRKKDIIVNSGGDNISPLRVESILTLCPEISQCLVYGDKQPHLVALVVPSVEFIAEWSKNNRTSPDLAELKDNPQFVADLYKVVEKANKELSVIEKVRKIIIPKEPFSVENEMLTPTLKVRRNQIKAVYGEKLLALYGKKGASSSNALPSA